MILTVFRGIYKNYPFFNFAISVVGSWISDSNYERALVLNKASLDMICAPSVGEEQAAMFENFYYAVRYIFNEAKLKKG